MRRIYCMALLSILFCSLTRATTIRRLSFDQLVGRSELIVHGKVLATRSYVVPSRGWIVTDTRIEVLDAIKGQVGTFVTVTELGGIVEDRGMLVPGTASFRVGEEMVIFLKNVDGRWRTSGLIQGKFPIVEEQGEKLVVPAVPVGMKTAKISLGSLVERVQQAERNQQPVR
ncbi:MAG: hypothetical protein HY644_10635 [Acidobacteria bacterium]|nr:hypothetical protein [Acidobacteriota bacterium]